MTKRAILYARVSGDDRHREGRNLAGQIEMCRRFAAERGWSVIAELSEDDRGASGASFELPQLNKVREMAYAHEFDILVVREIDRLSRSLAKQLIVEEELKRSGVAIDYVLGEYPDTPEGNLMKNVRATVAEYEREKICERMVRGRRQRVAGGSVLMHGHTPFGYREIEADGKFVLVIDEEEAEVVRMIFGLYIQGSNPRRIAQELSEMAIPTYADKQKNPNGKKRPVGSWSWMTIYLMLRNETYAGLWRYGETAIPVDVPAIIDRATWNAAQTRVKVNKENAKRSLKHQYLMRRRLTCGACGAKMRGQARTSRGVLFLYYRCPANWHGIYTHDCNMPSFRVELVDTAIWGWIKEFLRNPQALTEGLAAEQAERERINAPLKTRLRVVADLLAENQAQLARLLDLYLVGDFPKEMLLERKSSLEGIVESLEREFSTLTAQVAEVTLTAEQVTSITEFAATVAEGLEAAEGDFDARRRIVELLNVEATLAIEDGEQIAYVRCVLGEELLSLELNSTGTAILKERTPLIMTKRVVL